MEDHPHTIVLSALQLLRRRIVEPIDTVQGRPILLCRLCGQFLQADSPDLKGVGGCVPHP
jgi:hypothetical protein